MKPIPATLLGCVVGLALGWSLRSSGPEGREEEEFSSSRVLRPAVGTKFADRGVKGSGGGSKATSISDDTAPARHDLSVLLRSIHLHELEGDPYVVREAERLDTESLRSLVAAMTADSLLRDTQDQFEMSLSLKAIATVQFRREGVRALEWASQLPDPKVRELVVSQTIHAAFVQDPAAALSWVDRLKDMPGGALRYDFQAAAVMGATARGVDDLIVLRSLYGDRLHSSPWSGMPYAPDFDFKKLITDGPAAGISFSTSEAVTQWALRDRKAAFQALSAIGEGDNRRTDFARGIFTALIAAEGYEGAVREALAPFQNATGKERETMVRAMTSSLYENRGGAAKTMPFLPDADQKVLAQTMLSQNIDVTETGGALAAMSSSSVRMEILGDYLKSMGASFGGNEERKNKYYEDLMNAAHLTEEEKTRIRGQFSRNDPSSGDVREEIIWSHPEN